MWKVFSQSGPQTALTTMNRPVKPTPGEEGEKKKQPGECPNHGLLSSLLTFKRARTETAVSKMPHNIPCQGKQQKENSKAETSS